MSVNQIPRAYVSLCRQLKEGGGVGHLDRHCRVIVGPTKHPIAGGPAEWLWLTAHGLIQGDGGTIGLTAKGLEEIKAYESRLSMEETAA